MRLISVCATATVAPNKAVSTPIQATTCKAAEVRPAPWTFVAVSEAGSGARTAASTGADGPGSRMASRDTMPAEPACEAGALSGVPDISGDTPAVRNTPPATLVAPGISPLTGGRPSIASGHQTSKDS